AEAEAQFAIDAYIAQLFGKPTEHVDTPLEPFIGSMKRVSTMNCGSVADSWLYLTGSTASSSPRAFRP
ncbi:hypothetical protein OC610_28870, partial [Pseudomonas sp. SAICEU22]